MYLLARRIYRMSSACLTVREAAFASSFKHALVISFINRRALEILGKDVPMSFSHGAYFADSKMVERHKTLGESTLQENITFPLNVRKWIFQTRAGII